MDWRRASDVRERWSHTPTTVAYRPQVGPAMIAFAAAAVALPVPTHSMQGEPFLTRRKREQVLLLFMAGRPPSLPCRIPILPLAVGVSARTPFSLGLAPDADLEAQEGAFQGLEKANATKASETVAGQSSRRTKEPMACVAFDCVLANNLLCNQLFGRSMMKTSHLIMVKQQPSEWFSICCCTSRSSSLPQVKLHCGQ
ncbi:hypothetical protein BHM03_00005895 [Ensete ventricosum]|nr:hypothetical protein BHM03_00005895 [Ensete ventricosum]